jgi:hypothetical protein
VRGGIVQGWNQAGKYGAGVMPAEGAEGAEVRFQLEKGDIFQNITVTQL